MPRRRGVETVRKQLRRQAGVEVLDQGRAFLAGDDPEAFTVHRRPEVAAGDVDQHHRHPIAAKPTDDRSEVPEHLVRRPVLVEHVVHAELDDDQAGLHAPRVAGEATDRPGCRVPGAARVDDGHPQGSPEPGGKGGLGRHPLAGGDAVPEKDDRGSRRRERRAPWTPEPQAGDERADAQG